MMILSLVRVSDRHPVTVLIWRAGRRSGLGAIGYQRSQGRDRECDGERYKALAHCRSPLSPSRPWRFVFGLSTIASYRWTSRRRALQGLKCLQKGIKNPWERSGLEI